MTPLHSLPLRVIGYNTRATARFNDVSQLTRCHIPFLILLEILTPPVTFSRCDERRMDSLAHHANSKILSNILVSIE
jgi:hypothetical protein